VAINGKGADHEYGHDPNGAKSGPGAQRRRAGRTSGPRLHRSPVGFLASLLLPLFAARARSRLWPQTSPNLGHLCAALAMMGSGYQRYWPLSRAAKWVPRPPHG
jgi:hypothetical protein